jgi:hypothetical protein
MYIYCIVIWVACHVFRPPIVAIFREMFYEAILHRTSQQYTSTNNFSCVTDTKFRCQNQTVGDTWVNSVGHRWSGNDREVASWRKRCHSATLSTTKPTWTGLTCAIGTSRWVEHNRLFCTTAKDTSTECNVWGVCTFLFNHFKGRWALYGPHSGHYTDRNIYNSAIVRSAHTQCIYMFCVDLRTNSDYFPIQH